MVRNYKRKTNRGGWDVNKMEAAIRDVLRNKLSCKKASITYEVPRTTLQRKLKECNGETILQPKRLGNFKPVFTTDQEEELASYIKDMESRLFGLSRKEVRQLAYQLAETNQIQNNFDKATKTAGEDWLTGFLKRNPSLSVRKPEATSVARAMGFNREAVKAFFKLLTDIVDKHKITPDKLFNVDETGMTTVSKSVGKVIATKGRKQVGCLSSAERGQLFTVEICVSANGSFMPPMFIFPRKRLKPELMDGAPTNSWAECNEKGWVTQEIFAKWFRKFVSWSGATKDQPVLLLLDGHASHVKNLEIIYLARDNGVNILCFPPHCTHKLQPLDVSFMKPLSTFYGDEVKKWLRTNPGRVVTHFQVTSLFSNAFLRAATMLVAVNGFRKTGIWPVNPNVFRDYEYLASETTDISLEEVRSPPTPSPSPLTNIQPPVTPPPGTSSSFQMKSPADILPTPKAKLQKRISRKRGKAALITNSPYKNDLEQNQLKTVQNKSSASKDQPKKQQKKTKKKKLVAGKENKFEEEDAECLYCGEWYSQSFEGWVTCRGCQRWAHCSCAGEEDNKKESLHICIHCSHF